MSPPKAQEVVVSVTSPSSDLERKDDYTLGTRLKESEGKARDTETSERPKIKEHESKSQNETYKEAPHHNVITSEEASRRGRDSEKDSTSAERRLGASSSIQPSNDEELESKFSDTLLSLEDVYSEPLYKDPTPRTPRETSPLPASADNAEISSKNNSSRRDAEEKGAVTGEADDNEMTEEGGPDSEIKSIIDQFDQGSDDLGNQRTYLVDAESTAASPMVTLSQHPPRKSSLEHPTPEESITSTALHLSDSDLSRSRHGAQEKSARKSRVRADLVPIVDHPAPVQDGPVGPDSPIKPGSPSLRHKPLPPAPDPESDLPFDFHRFLEQLRHRTADPVAKFLRSFLVEFGKKQWMVHEQVKIVSDFLAFITGKMMQCEVWREVSDAEFDNAKEGMEKLVMNRLYSQTFSPAIPPQTTISTSKGKRKVPESQMNLGRRGQHQEDIERDDVLAQKVRIYGWVREQHLDIIPIGEGGRRFLVLAQQELLKIKTYRAPRDKIICVLNCCKVIFGLLRNSKASDTSADSFIPLLIHVVLQANPEHLVSNIQYILRFRNQDKLVGETGYYVSSLMGAIQFIENLDRTALTISDEEFERNVEAAVSAIAERDKDEFSTSRHPYQGTQVFGEAASSNESEFAMTRQRQFERPKELVAPPEEKIPASGLLRTIQKPLSSIGRIFSDDVVSPHSPGNFKPQQVSLQDPETPRRLSPAVFQPPRSDDESSQLDGLSQPLSSIKLSAEDAAARQASAEAAEALKIQRAEHKDVVETLAGMFPNLDRDVIDDVVRLKEGRVGSAVDACLALNM